jgi:hypothetical protein
VGRAIGMQSDGRSANTEDARPPETKKRGCDSAASLREDYLNQVQRDCLSRRRQAVNTPSGELPARGWQRVGF